MTLGSEFQFNEPEYEWSYEIDQVDQAECSQNLSQVVEEINWNLSPILTSSPKNPKSPRKQNYGSFQQSLAEISDSDEATEDSPLLQSFDRDAVVKGLLDRTNETEIRIDRQKMKKICLSVLAILAVLALIFLAFWVPVKVNCTFWNFLVIIIFVIIVIIFSGCMANCHYSNEIQALRRGEQI